MTDSWLKNLQRKARARLRLRNDPRFQKVVQVMQAHGLLYAPEYSAIGPQGLRITFESVEFAGNLEPRILEVLPALAYRRPKVFLDPWNMPKDLKETLKAIRMGSPLKSFRGVTPERYMQWVDRMKNKNSQEKVIRKDFRFSKEDVELLESLKLKLKLDSHTEVIRKALRSL